MTPLCPNVQSPSSVHPSPIFPTPSHGPITFLIAQNGVKNYQSLETLTIQGKNWFWNGSQLIDWLGISKCHRTDKLIDWLFDYYSQ